MQTDVSSQVAGTAATTTAPCDLNQYSAPVSTESPCTGILVTPAAAGFRGERFEQGRIGLHHFCLRARSRDDIDELHAFLAGLGARIVHPPEEARWAPGYYSVLFEDRDGIRIEANFVPGKNGRSDT